jgi:hypothetical protein
MRLGCKSIRLVPITSDTLAASEGTWITVNLFISPSTNWINSHYSRFIVNKVEESVMEPAILWEQALVVGGLLAHGGSVVLEGGGKELGKKLVDKLWKTVDDRFQGEQRAEVALQNIQHDPSPENLELLARYLKNEMELNAVFREELLAILAENQQQEPEMMQKMLVGVKAKEIRAKDLRQRGEVTGSQEMLVKVEADVIDLGNLTQEQ